MDRIIHVPKRGSGAVLCLAALLPLLAFAPARAEPLPAGVKAQTSDEGLAVADADGHLLYRLDTDRLVQRRKDAAAILAQRCGDDCHRLWRPAAPPAGFVARGDWTLVTRGAAAQLAYKGDPLYRFMGASLDEAARLQLLPPYAFSYAAKPTDFSSGVPVATLYWHAVLYQPPEPDAPTPAGVSLKWRRTAYVFADSRGRPLYTGGVGAACGSDCGELQPLRAPLTALPIAGWAPIQAPDGERDWSYRGRPVFHSQGDADPGAGWQVLEAKPVR